jgi:hypothetical protein
MFFEESEYFGSCHYSISVVMGWIHQFFVMYYLLIVQALQANFMSLQVQQH